MKKIFLIVSLVIVVCLISCGKSKVYQARHSFENNVWERITEGKTIDFENIEIQDTSSVYDIYLTIRHAPFINEDPIKILLSITSPTGIVRQSVHTIELKDRFQQKWLGDAMGDMIDLEQKIRSFVNFPAKGNYKISITNMGNYKQMVGIVDIGIIVKKSNLDEYKNVK